MVLVKVGRAYTGECINIMVQALQTEDSSLPQGLTVQNMYMELRQGSKKGSCGRKEQYGLSTDPLEENPSGQGSSSTSGAQTSHGSPFAGGGDKPQDPHTHKLTVRQRHGKLFDELDLSGLDAWPQGWWILPTSSKPNTTKVFSLDPADLGCTHSTEHMIKVTDDTPFKE